MRNQNRLEKAKSLVIITSFLCFGVFLFLIKGLQIKMGRKWGFVFRSMQRPQEMEEGRIIIKQRHGKQDRFALISPISLPSPHPSPRNLFQACKTRKRLNTLPFPVAPETSHLRRISSSAGLHLAKGERERKDGMAGFSSSFYPWLSVTQAFQSMNR